MSEVAFCETLTLNANNLEYETISHENGNSTVIKFPIDVSRYSPGDVVVILDDADIIFHGIIGKIEDNFAFASDPKGSLLPATTQ
jgi:hypothetical protein